MKSLPIFQESISRRDFLIQTAVGFLSLGSLRLFGSQINFPPSINESFLRLGRTLKPTTPIFKQPSFNSKKIDECPFNSILNLTQTVRGEANQYSNYQWFQLQAGGFIHASEVQLVENRINDIVLKFNRNGQLAQVTVPFTEVRRIDRNNRHSNEIFYYGSTHWVESLTKDENGNTFYRIREDRFGDTCFVNAAYLHLITEHELLPISSHIAPQDKYLVVRLYDQLVLAYEGEKLIFLSPMSSGLISGKKDLSTPYGEYKINYKRPSRHMTHGDRTGFSDGDLFGVPWVTYFTDDGIAFHGTYWHNDFGFPRSHGCVNLPIQAAYWLYRWSLPTVPPLEKKYISRQGTRVLVI